MAALEAAIQNKAGTENKSWMAGSSPAMTRWVSSPG